jgi:hypothetical protein
VYIIEHYNTIIKVIIAHTTIRKKPFNSLIYVIDAEVLQF